jgi:hypothetical protein
MPIVHGSGSNVKSESNKSGSKDLTTLNRNTNQPGWNVIYHDSNLPIISEFDIIREVRENRDEYVGDTWLSMLVYPSICRTNIDRLKTKASVGTHPITAACIYWGLNKLSSEAVIKDLTYQKYRFDSAPNSLPGFVSNILSGFLNKFEVTLPSGRRYNTRLSDEHHTRLSGISKALGIDKQRLAILSIFRTLIVQEATNIDDSREMKRCVDDFVKLVQYRGRLIKAGMNEFLVPEVRETEEFRRWSQNLFYD